MNRFLWCTDSPYCRLVKAVLIVKQFPHDDVVLNWEDLQSLPQILKVQSEFKRVPVLQTDDYVFSDSGRILHNLGIFSENSQYSDAFLLYRIADSDLGRVLQTVYHAKKLERKFGHSNETQWLVEQAQKELALSLGAILVVLGSSTFSTNTIASNIARLSVQIFLTFIQSLSGQITLKEFCAVKKYLIGFEEEEFFETYQKSFQHHAHKISLRL